MGKRGPKPKGKVKIKWSSNFAYAIGLITTDGCLYNDGRHISFTSKDLVLAELFKICLSLTVKIGKKASSSKLEKKYYHVQFGDVIFYHFLLSIGLMPAKSKIMAEMCVPDKYFFDFIRGCFDGDGHFYSYWDLRWKSSYMFYTVFSSASKNHINWLQSQLFLKLGIHGHITKNSKKPVYNLKYAKKESIVLLPKIYYSKHVCCLDRKRDKIKMATVLKI